MTQSHCTHLAIIMDGNGRWAERRGLPRLAGHCAGERALRRITAAAPNFGISTLTVYAFSSDNWKRPAGEISGLMNLLETHLARELGACLKNGVRLSMIGRRDRIPETARWAVEETERLTQNGRRLHLRLAIDYSSRDAMLAAWQPSCAPYDRQAFAERLNSPDVDLLIRTAGEQRLSDFLLWESAYAELYFTPVLWPDFNADDLETALEEFARRVRRFGGLPGQTVRTPTATAAESAC
jgi:undecaprenyl diphosphate synthase